MFIYIFKSFLYYIIVPLADMQLPLFKVHHSFKHRYQSYYSGSFREPMESLVMHKFHITQIHIRCMGQIKMPAFRGMSRVSYEWHTLGYIWYLEWGRALVNQRRDSYEIYPYIKAHTKHLNTAVAFYIEIKSWKTVDNYRKHYNIHQLNLSVERIFLNFWRWVFLLHNLFSITYIPCFFS